MKENNKTKEQLINELAEIRQKIAEFEASKAVYKRAEEALAEERSLLRTMIDNLPDYITVKDIKCRFVVNNMAHVHILGATTLDELIGKTDFDIFPQELAAQYYADDQEVIRSGQPLVNQEEVTIDPGGKRQYLLTTALFPKFCY